MNIVAVPEGFFTPSLLFKRKGFWFWKHSYFSDCSARINYQRRVYGIDCAHMPPIHDGSAAPYALAFDSHLEEQFGNSAGESGVQGSSGLHSHDKSASYVTETISSSSDCEEKYNGNFKAGL
ncbi:MAG: hypothetical protein LBL71_03575 [Endomicrobium sp.]|jgi:hypothetical protein|nr:hypothetical protein [Endomicrobium sp.]